ncbi:hypothetical protein [Rhizobium leguminosarum]|jgi:hypothetical protein|uniref:hypothetical protein n=1 Tax=Rhizobium leguminosarum TaxID=384 RepID=UPI002E0E9B86|nr:hypothetical protein U8Q02_42710 [Rhizobium leguminosarum]
MTEYVLSRNGVVHEVIEDDGARMVLQNPSGSRITVTKSRDKFRPLSVIRTMVDAYRLDDQRRPEGGWARMWVPLS